MALLHYIPINLFYIAFQFILDPWQGCNNHMICSPLFYYFTPKPIKASINLPNGITILATYIGSACLSNTLFLHNVLCIPKFLFNLLFVFKLTKQSNLCLTFSASHHNLQDQSIKKKVRISFEKEWFYHLIEASSNVQTCNASQFNSTPFASTATHKQLDIWHYRQGHVYSLSLSSLKQIEPSITLDCTNVCDICPLAKQRKLPFSVSQNKSNKRFDLIHCDIWGSFWHNLIFWF